MTLTLDKPERRDPPQTPPPPAVAVSDTPQVSAKELDFPPPPPTPQRMRFTPAMFELMAEVGVLPEKAELMDGEIYVMPPDGNEHSNGTADLLRPLILNWQPPKTFRCQSTHRFADGWLPMPDITLLDERPVRGAKVDPPPRLVVEISDTSLPFDLNDKKLRYARNGVPEYWAADLRRRRILVFRDPVPDAATAEEAWRTEAIIEADGEVSPLCIPDLTIKVADVLPEPLEADD